MHYNDPGKLLKVAARSELADCELARAAADLEAQGYGAAADVLLGHARACRVDAIQLRALAGGQTYMRLAEQPVSRKS
jgi:hypothetical protein